MADIESFLAGTELFGALTPDAIGPLARAFSPVVVDAGEVVISEGDAAEALYLVHTGRLHVRRRREDGAEHLAEVGAGETVGELALVTDRPRSATVVASRDSRLLHLPLEAFESMVAEHPSTLRALTTQVVGHLERRRPRGTRLGVLAVVPLHDSPAVDQAISELVLAVRQGSDRVGVQREPPRDPVGFRTDRLEQTFDLVVSVASAEDGWWTASCIHHADRVVLVADATRDPALVAVEAVLASRSSVLPVRVELVLAHRPRRTAPVRTAAWLADRSVARHHHLRLGDPAHGARVARLLTDRGIGLVCSGGGARAMAELGVLQALEERGVPVDAITGTSAGAIVGGVSALGWPAGRVRRTLRRYLVDAGRPVEPTLPLVSLASGARAVDRLQAVCGDRDLEDAWIDFACVSTNLSTRERVVHRTGPAWRAVRASMSIPGVFPPVRQGDDLLVDGGVVDNLPVSVLLERHPGMRAVAVDVGARRDLSAGDLPGEAVVRGWPLLRDRLHPGRRSPRVAGIASIMARLAELGSIDEGTRDRAEIVIRPEVDDVGLLEFGRLDDLADRGHAAALHALPPGWPWSVDP